MIPHTGMVTFSIPGMSNVRKDYEYCRHKMGDTRVEVMSKEALCYELHSS